MVDGIENNTDLIVYSISGRVTAFTTKRDAVLPFPVVQAHQRHTVNVAEVHSADMTREDLDGIDALITDRKGIAIGARTADCIPVLLYDESHHAAAAVHSGWRGTVGRISAVTISEMISRYGTDPSELKAVIGPGIGFDSFQVGDEVVDRFREEGFPMDMIYRNEGEKVPGSMKGGDHIDLWQAVKWTLEESGVKPENITVAGICSYSSNDILFSARREGISCGRTLSVIRIDD